MTDKDKVAELYKRTRSNTEHYSINVNSVFIERDLTNRFLYKGTRILWCGDFEMFLPFTLAKLIIDTKYEHREV